MYKEFSLFESGFRPLFLCAAVYAVLSMIVWTLIYTLNFNPKLYYPVKMSWHAHEMVYGYSLAVIAGFLLTAVKNWTGIQTLTGYRLAAFCGLWIASRLLSFTSGSVTAALCAVLDTLFAAALVYAVSRPVIKARDRRQKGVILLLVLLTFANIIYYIGVLSNNHEFVRAGIYGGIYLIVAMILIISRRVIPGFTERGVGYSVSLTNFSWIDRSNLQLFAVFALLDLFTGINLLTACFAFLLFLMNLVRIAGWYTHGIWRKPLLWVLFAAYGFIVSGFGLKAISYIYPVNPYIHLHAFTAGGIGLMTVGMMSRVSLGHTGRSVHQVPVTTRWIFLILVAGILFRILGPLLAPADYIIWIALSQVLWISSFTLFLMQYSRVLIYPRVDGKPG